MTVIHADEYPIKSVKLFQGSASAEITRTFPLPFLHSQDEPQIVEILHLPASIQSVDVSITSASRNVTILDHCYHTLATKPGQPSPTPSSETLRGLEAERQRLEDEKRFREQSCIFLSAYMESFARSKSQGQSEATQMVPFLDEFVEIGIARSAVIAELDGKLADVGNKIAEESVYLLKLNSELPVKVVAILSCNSEVPVEAAELTVTYVVKQVSWKPAYDLHIAMTGNVPSPVVKLDFRCTVTQWTGENWENISLALTTADQVSQLIQLPGPKRIDISLAPTHPFQPANTSRTSVFRQVPDAPSGFKLRRTSLDEELDREREYQSLWGQHSPFGLVSPPMPPVQAVEETPGVEAPLQTVSQLISHDSKDPITHIASARLSIPSDHVEHHVLVSSLSLIGKFMLVVAPSIDTRVYYTCEVKNTSEYVLLPGTVKIYLNDKHVSSTEIHNTGSPQILECSLAVNTRLKTIYNRAPDALRSTSRLTGKATTTYTSAIVLENTHTEQIQDVIVRSSIPLSADPRITIILKEPAGLADIDEGSVSVKEGCLARWSTTGGWKGKQAGLFEWVCDVNPGTETLKAVWEVCAPQDLKLLEQLRS